MKHVIIIETPDEYDDKEFKFDAERFEEITTETVQALSDRFTKGACVVYTKFNVASAIDVVLEMYGTNRKDFKANDV